jgi:hypothetical protein
MVNEQFDLGIRNDIRGLEGDGWHSGCKGIRAVDLEEAVEHN